MKLAIPIIDTEINRDVLSAGLNANGSICLYDVEDHSAACMRTSELAENMGDLLPELASRQISAIITLQVHPMALKILINKGFTVYKAKGNQLKENIQLFQNKMLEQYSHEASMELATVCGGECTTCSTDTCDEEKKSDVPMI
jgi:predicted Fe-Mo cluster-binding NifX family protein